MNNLRTAYLLDGGNVVAEVQNNTVTDNYLRGVNLIRRTSTDETEYYLFNAHGDVVTTTNPNGTVNQEYDYDAFGNEKNPDALDTNPFRYCGEYLDFETGDYYLRARYYDPSIGRFTQEDTIWAVFVLQWNGQKTIDPLSLNLYVYCVNNPIKYWDPSGHITQDEIDMYENGKMAPMAFSYLMDLTYQWYLADTQEERDYYHQLAEDFRANDYKTTNGLFENVDAGIADMPKKPSGWNGVIPLSLNEHFFRNKLNLEFSWEELQKLNERLPDNMRWTTVIASMHQNHRVNNTDNVKYVSADGHFELVFDANHVLLTAANNPDDMGTYNYYSPITNKDGHFYYDVLPYMLYGFKNVR